MSASLGPVFARRDYAGFFRRTTALFIDASLLFGAFVVAIALITPESRQWIGPIVAAWVLLSTTYMIGLRLTEGGTLGYRLMRIRYVYMLGGTPPFIMRVARALWAVFLLSSLAIDHFWILCDEHKQAWHDKIAGFYVVRCGAQPIAMVA